MTNFGAACKDPGCWPAAITACCADEAEHSLLSSAVSLELGAGCLSLPVMAYLLLVEVLLLLLPPPVPHHWREALVVHSLPSLASYPARLGLLPVSVKVTCLFQLPW